MKTNSAQTWPFLFKISIIIPTLNEAECIQERLARLQDLRSSGHEVIVADGGSTDSTVQLAAGHVDQLVRCEPGRARQMNRGAEEAEGDLLLFLHADTSLPEGVAQLLHSALIDDEFASGAGVGIGSADAKDCWGWFRVRLSNPAAPYRIIAGAMNLRSHITHVSTGDQSLFVTPFLFKRAGGFPDIPLMEDVAISKTLRKFAGPRIIRKPVVTSSRRWEQRGLISTVLLMWLLRLAYYMGVSPARLAKIYYPGS